MDYIESRLSNIMSANDLEKEIQTKQNKLTVEDNTDYITLTIDGVEYKLTKYIEEEE